MSLFDTDQDALGAVDAEFFEENRGMTDDGGVEAASDGGDDDEPPRSLRTPFMAVGGDGAPDCGSGRETRLRKLTTERVELARALNLTLAAFHLVP